MCSIVRSFRVESACRLEVWRRIFAHSQLFIAGRTTRTASICVCIWKIYSALSLNLKKACLRSGSLAVCDVHCQGSRVREFFLSQCLQSLKHLHILEKVWSSLSNFSISNPQLIYGEVAAWTRSVSFECKLIAERCSPKVFRKCLDNLERSNKAPFYCTPTRGVFADGVSQLVRFDS